MDSEMVQSARRAVMSQEIRDLVKMVDDGESMSDIYDKLVAGPLIRFIEYKA